MIVYKIIMTLCVLAMNVAIVGLWVSPNEYGNRNWRLRNEIDGKLHKQANDFIDALHNQDSKKMGELIQLRTDLMNQLDSLK